MRKAISQTITNSRSRQSNPEKATDDAFVFQQSSDIVQATLRHFGINVQKPKHVAARSRRAHVQLRRSTARSLTQVIAMGLG